MSCKTRVHIKLLQAVHVKCIYEVFLQIHSGIYHMWLAMEDEEDESLQSFFFFRKKAAVFLCTDNAAQGLDFPAVHWVEQLGCPEDANTYIHRARSTARYEEDGKAFAVSFSFRGSWHFKSASDKEDSYDSNPEENCPNSEKVGDVFFTQDPEMKHWAQRSLFAACDQSTCSQTRSLSTSAPNNQLSQLT